LDMKMVARFQQKKGAAPALMLDGDIRLHDLQLNSQDDKSIAQLPELTVTLQNAKVLDQRIDIARVALKGLQADIDRDAKGRFNFDNLLIPPAPAKKPAEAAAPAQASTATTSTDASAVASADAAASTGDESAPAKPAGLSLALATLDIEDAALRFNDAGGDRPLKAGVEHFNLQVRNTVFDATQSTLAVEEVASSHAELMLQQGKQKRYASKPAASSTTAKKASGQGKTQDAGMIVTIGKIAVADWSAKLEDRGLPRPAVTTIAPLTLNVQDFSTAAAALSTLDL